MAQPKAPESYPAALQMLLEHFRSSEAAAVPMRFSRVADAEKIRFTFYSFKKSLQKTGREDELRVANGILARIINDEAPGVGATLEFSLRDNVGWALQLEAALAESLAASAGASPTPQAETASTTPLAAQAPNLSSDDAVDKYLKK